MFGGGEAENMFRSFLLQEYGKTVAKAGGVGISDMVQRQLLELQEASK
jgi:Rod binding domain-containing protein